MIMRQCRRRGCLRRPRAHPFSRTRLTTPSLTKSDFLYEYQPKRAMTMMLPGAHEAPCTPLPNPSHSRGCTGLDACHPRIIQATPNPCHQAPDQVPQRADRGPSRTEKSVDECNDEVCTKLRGARLLLSPVSHLVLAWSQMPMLTALPCSAKQRLALGRISMSVPPSRESASNR